MSTARTGFRRLRRSSDGQLLAGLCAGAGRELRVDPVLLRVALVLLTLYSGIGAVLYLAGWMLIPMDEGSSNGARAQRRRFVATLVVVLLGLVFLPWWGVQWQNVSLTMLALLGLYMLLRRPATEAVDAETGDAESVGTESADAGTAPTSPAPETAPGKPPAGKPAAGTREPTAPATPSAPAQASSTGASSAASVDWPARPTPTGEDAVHTIQMPTGWSEPPTGQPTGQPGPDHSENAPTGRPSPGWQPSGEPASASWRSFEPAPSSFWEQPDPLGLRDADDDAAADATQQLPWDADDTRPIVPGAHSGGTTQLPTNAAYANAGPNTGRSPRRTRFLLLFFTVVGAFLTVGVLASAVDDPPISGLVAAGLGVVGTGLVVGTWVGRSIGLMVIGILTSCALLPLTVVDMVSTDVETSDRGTIRSTPANVQEISPRYELAAGDVRLDLSQVSFTDTEETSTKLELGTGQAVVLVPPNVDVEAHIEAGAGEVEVFGQRHEGWGQDRRVTDQGDDGPGGGNLQLNIESGLGMVEVRRAEPSTR